MGDPPAPAPPGLDAARRAGIRVVGIGASAGGVEALQRVVSEFDDALAVAVAVVLHVPASTRSLLPQILDRRSRAPAAHAVDGEAVRPGRIYVAPPDVHLVVDADGRFHLTRGPRENDHRPSIDTLFRSLAAGYGPAVAAVILTGTLDDGAAGLAAVTRAGGIAAVQSEQDAAFPSMPRAARSATRADAVGTAEEIGRLIRSLGPQAGPRDEAGPPTAGRATGGASGGPTTVESADAGPGRLRVLTTAVDAVDLGRPPSLLACPDCHGPLWEVAEGGRLRRYRCRVGHSWTEDALVDRQAMELERALWMAVRLLDERLELLRKMQADDAEHLPAGGGAPRLAERIRQLEEHGRLLRGVLADRSVDGGGADP
jgi:two-component system chemotaxis response regulator CheB